MLPDWIRKWLGGSKRRNESSSPSPTKTKQSPKASKPVAKKVEVTPLYEDYVGELKTAFLGHLLGLPKENESVVDDTQVATMVKRLLRSQLKLDNLPRRPNSLPTLMKLLKRDDISFTEIAEALQEDPALISKILKTANSPHFKISEQAVESLEHALSILGLSGVRQVLSAVAMKPVFEAKDQEDVGFSHRAWEWAMMAGKATDSLGQSQGHSAGSLFLLGLLPAVSMILVNRALCAELAEQKAASFPPEARAQVIIKLYWVMCRSIRGQWGLSDEYDDMIRQVEKREPEGRLSPLNAGQILAMHAYLEGKDCTVLNERQVMSILPPPSETNRALLESLLQSVEDAAV